MSDPKGYALQVLGEGGPHQGGSARRQALGKGGQTSSLAGRRKAEDEERATRRQHVDEERAARWQREDEEDARRAAEWTAKMRRRADERRREDEEDARLDEEDARRAAESAGKSQCVDVEASQPAAAMVPPSQGEDLVLDLDPAPHAADETQCDLGGAQKRAKVLLPAISVFCPEKGGPSPVAAASNEAVFRGESVLGGGGGGP